MSQLIQSNKPGRLKKVASAADLIALTVQDYSNLVQAINSKVNLTGSAMTGYLTLHANPTANLHAAPKQYVDSVASSNTTTHAALTSAVHGSTSTNLANRIVQRDASGRISVGSPVNPDHAVTLQYFSDNLDSALGAHTAATNVHGATSTATPSRLMIRDSAGRVSVAAPVNPDQAAQLANVTAALNALYEHIEDPTQPHAAASTFEAVANTMMIRDESGRVQINNPASGKDAANYQWVLGILGGYAAINPIVPKNGDLSITSTTASVRVNGAWRQVWPAQYS